MVEIWVSDNGSFTVLITRPSGLSCIIASGENWRSFRELPDIGTHRRSRNSPFKEQSRTSRRSTPFQAQGVPAGSASLMPDQYSHMDFGSQVSVRPSLNSHLAVSWTSTEPQDQSNRISCDFLTHWSEYDGDSSSSGVHKPGRPTNCPRVRSGASPSPISSGLNPDQEKQHRVFHACRRFRQPSRPSSLLPATWVKAGGPRASCPWVTSRLGCGVARCPQ